MVVILKVLGALLLEKEFGLALNAFFLKIHMFLNIRQFQQELF